MRPSRVNARFFREKSGGMSNDMVLRRMAHSDICLVPSTTPRGVIRKFAKIKGPAVFK